MRARTPNGEKKQQQQPSGRPNRQQRAQFGRRSSEDQELIEQLAKLALKAEDAVSRLQQDTMTIMQFKNQQGAPDAILPVLYQVATAWKNKHQKDSRSVGMPMRQSVFIGLLTELRARLTKLQEFPESQAVAVKHGWLTEQKEWVVLTWDPDRQKQIRQGHRTVTQTQMLADLDQCITWAQQEGVLTKFSPTRPLAAEMSGEVITYICELSLRNTAATQLHHKLREWQGLSSLLMA